MMCPVTFVGRIGKAPYKTFADLSSFDHSHTVVALVVRIPFQREMQLFQREMQRK